MNHCEPIHDTAPTRQKGAALFMALIVLLVLTILGVFGMNMARLENLMAGNTQFQAAALNNAEEILAVGEQDVASKIGKNLDWNDPTKYLHDRTINSNKIIDPQNPNWDFVYKPINANARYVLEYAGEYTDFQCSVKWGATYSDECKRYIFLVTAQNEASRGAKRTVQSVYVSATPP